MKWITQAFLVASQQTDDKSPPTYCRYVPLSAESPPPTLFLPFLPLFLLTPQWIGYLCNFPPQPSNLPAFPKTILTYRDLKSNSLFCKQAAFFSREKKSCWLWVLVTHQTLPSPPPPPFFDGGYGCGWDSSAKDYLPNAIHTQPNNKHIITSNASIMFWANI